MHLNAHLLLSLFHFCAISYNTSIENIYSSPNGQEITSIQGGAATIKLFTHDEIDELSEELIRQNIGTDTTAACYVDIEAQHLKLPLLYRAFAGHDTDKIGYISNGITPLWIAEDGTTKDCIYPKGTIFIERYLKTTRRT